MKKDEGVRLGGADASMTHPSRPRANLFSRIPRTVGNKLLELFRNRAANFGGKTPAVLIRGIGGIGMGFFWDLESGKISGILNFSRRQKF